MSRRFSKDDDLAAATEALRASAPPPPDGMDERVLAAVARDRPDTAPARAPLRRSPLRPGTAPARAPLRRSPLRLRGGLAAALGLGAAVVLLALLARPGPVSDEARAVAIVPLTADCGAGPARSLADSGRLLVAGVWSGPEARAFARVLERFERSTGIRVTFAYETRNIAAALKARIRRGCAPDVALLPQPGFLADLARAGRIHPLDAGTQALVRRNYRSTWQRLATVGGRQYGVWFKAADKSLVWYRPAALRAAGIDRPPTTWPDLLETARRLAAAGIRPLSIAGAGPWTLTDWFENLYLRTAGPVPYERLAQHRIPWTDPTVTRVLRQLAVVFGDPRLVGTPQATLETSFEDSVAEVFGPRPRAAMVYEADFVRNFLPRAARTGRGPDAARFFEFPRVTESSPPTAVVGGDVAVQFSRSDAARRLMRFLATPEAAGPWARAGGFLSPNRRVSPRAYPDALTRRAAAALARAQTVRFDLSDLQPPAFGATAEQGMWSIFQGFLADPRHPDRTARRLEAAATAAWACERAIAGRC